MKLIIITLAAIFYSQGSGLYGLEMPSIGGGTVRLADYEGNYLLFVNISGDTSLPGQLAGLQQLSDSCGQKLTVVAVPSNSFGHQPDADSTFRNMLDSALPGITFQVLATSDVAGANKCTLYQWLSDSATNGMVDNPVAEDYQKYLVDRQGRLVGVFGRQVSPLDEGIIKLIN